MSHSKSHLVRDRNPPRMRTAAASTFPGCKATVVPTTSSLVQEWDGKPQAWTRIAYYVQNEEPVGITWDINRVVKDGFIMTARVWTTSTGHINGIVTHWSVYTSV